MLEHIKIGNILFLDIETVPGYPVYQDLPPGEKMLWEKKAGYLKKEDETTEAIYNKAGIYAEFGRIVCISTGMIGMYDDRRMLRLKSFWHTDEKTLLESFADLVEKLCRKKEIDLCAHNGKEFDFPFISRRMLINGVPLPDIFETSGKKPWEVRHLDTMELWKFGDHKHYTSLELLASVFGLESPKSDLDGSQVAHVYWIEHDVSRIVQYCRKDVITLAQLMLKFKSEPLLGESDIMVLDHP